MIIDTNTKKQFRPGMLPQDLSEIVIDSLKNGRGVQKFELQTNEAVTLSNQDGFRVLVRYQNKSGLWKKEIHYGFIYNQKFYNVYYEAAEQYYYDQNKNAFDGFISSFHLI